jgi:hypothetical protein
MPIGISFLTDPTQKRGSGDELSQAAIKLKCRVPFVYFLSHALGDISTGRQVGRKRPALAVNSMQ